MLSSQAKVDARACIDENRLWYILNNQGNLRTEHFQGITDAIDRGCTRGYEIGKVVILPATQTYMIQNYHDSIAICRVFGPPDFFFTFTCNPNGPEIANSYHDATQRPSDKSDVIVRVYHMKLEELIQDIKSGKLFGPCNVGTFSLPLPSSPLPHVVSTKKLVVCINTQEIQVIPVYSEVPV
jgi:hypothetical protein